jgi:hypothetical protein
MQRKCGTFIVMLVLRPIHYSIPLRCRFSSLRFPSGFDFSAIINYLGAMVAYRPAAENRCFVRHHWLLLQGVFTCLLLKLEGFSA